MHFGIDYGSKLAGTTVITYDIEGELFQISSAKKEDADAMIRKAAIELKPSAIYLDAPLSLPNAYFGKGDDYFYRIADKELRAMSPMFLGGLTARAMQLKAYIKTLNIDMYETYPGALVRSIPQLKENYSKKDNIKIPQLMREIESLLGKIKVAKQPENMHQIDSILAWYSGFRNQSGMANQIGDRKEGLIIF